MNRVIYAPGDLVMWIDSFSGIARAALVVGRYRLHPDGQEYIRIRWADTLGVHDAFPNQLTLPPAALQPVGRKNGEKC